MRKLWTLIALLGLACETRATTVWIDTDVSIGSPFREVDDAYALMLAFHSPEIRIAAVSTTYGNAPLGHTTRTAREMIRQFGRSAGLNPSQVFAGAGSPRDLGRRSDASEALAAMLENERVTYVALGPLTNLATFLQLHPKSASRIERVVFLGGQAEGSTLAFGPTRSFHIHDANVFKDPAATAVVLRSKIPLTLVPIAIASNLTLDASDLRQLEQSGEAGNYLSSRSKIWLWFWTQFAKARGGPIFDALAVMAVARPELIHTKRRWAALTSANDLVAGTNRTKGSQRVDWSFEFARTTRRRVLKRLQSRSR